LAELVEEVKFNVRLGHIEKHVLVHRLRHQGSFETFDDLDLKNLVEEIQKEHKGAASKPEFPEVYPFLEEIADKLFLFISRDEVQALARLGIMGQQVTQLVAKDIQHLYQSMKKKRWQEQQKVKDSVGAQSFLRMQQEERAGPTGKADQQPGTDRSGLAGDQDIPQSTKKAPFQQPRSRDFFDSLKENDVLKCLNMLKENRHLVEDCDE